MHLTWRKTLEASSNMKGVQAFHNGTRRFLPLLGNKIFIGPTSECSWKICTQHYHRMTNGTRLRHVLWHHEKPFSKLQCYSSQTKDSGAWQTVGLDTIFSLSSGHGKCGVAVVRVSGPAVASILTKIGQFGEPPEPRKAYLRTLVHPEEGHAIDKGLVLYFPKPSSFTGEECVELQVHGGPAVVAALLSALHTVSGCRQAEPGEFTKRAFLNGKLDLTEVEGLGDLIHAETEAQRRQALRQMDGDLSRMYARWRRAVIKCVADLEAYIDFGEEQHIEDIVLQQVDGNVKTLRSEITRHINDNRQGERLREGVQVAIIGEPNVGKSSLLNLICQRPAAIVTEIAGTTRDVIDTPVNIGGYPVLLSDTAGLRETEDVVEKEGVTRALKRAQEADIRVLMLDVGSIDATLPTNLCSLHYVDSQLKSLGILTVSEHANSEQLDNLHFDPYDSNFDNAPILLNTIIVLNKSDLLTQDDLQKVSKKLCGTNNNLDRNLNTNNPAMTDCKTVAETNEENIEGSTELGVHRPVPVCCVSCIHGDGIEEFLNILKTRVADMCGNPLSGHPSLTQARHRSHLVACLQHLDDYDHMTRSGDVVLASHALRSALWEIGKITGKITSEEILDVIFKDFCIGK